MQKLAKDFRKLYLTASLLEAELCNESFPLNFLKSFEIAVLEWLFLEHEAYFEDISCDK